MDYMYDINPSTGLPMIDGNYTGVTFDKKDRNSFGYPHKETKQESDLNDIGAYIMLVLGSGFLVYAYRIEIFQFFGF